MSATTRADLNLTVERVQKRRRLTCPHEFSGLLFVRSHFGVKRSARWMLYPHVQELVRKLTFVAQIFQAE